MYCIEIRGIDKIHFVKYVAHNLNTQPNTHDIKYFFAQVDMDATPSIDQSSATASDERKCLLVPWVGEYSWHDVDGNIITIKISEEGEPQFTGGYLDYYYRIQVYHSNLNVLTHFVKTVLSFTKPIKNHQIKIFYSKSKGYWEHFDNIYVQPINKVYIDQFVKNVIFGHIDSFIESKERYITFGRPYKLNFLLTGVPGAGKTSLVKSIALKYQRPIYVLSFTKGLTDETLVDLMTEVKDNSIVLMEDIDSFFVDRESKNINVSFSALLNVMDGTIMKGNGTMIFLTANNPDRLDPALIRPGRVDHVIKFDYPRQQEVREAFKDITETDDESLFNEFYQKIKGVRINMSSIIDFLFRYHKSWADHIYELLTQTKLRDEITNDKVDKMYS